LWDDCELVITNSESVCRSRSGNIVRHDCGSGCDFGRIKIEIAHLEEEVMKASEVVVDAGRKLGEFGSGAAEFVSTVSNSAQEGMAAAKRTVRKGVHATEELLDDTAHTIKKNPFTSVGITLGIGLGAGVLIGWLAGRKR
jgi:ElaB/YqjD/DUF883 family membrane-anchored ribosome-binding protein